MTRVFVAVDLPPRIKDYLFELEKALQKKMKAKVRWVAKKNLHLTLKFFGEVSNENLGKIKKTLSSIEYPSFSMKLSGLGCFPDSSRPRVIWVGLSPQENIIRLQQIIDQETLDIPTKEQEFKVHLTLGRIKLLKKEESLDDIFSEIQEKTGEEFKITSFQFMQSTLTKDGPKYSIMENYQLK
jgi:2'-5' RNA ligase